MRSAWLKYGIVTIIILNTILAFACAGELKSAIDITKVGKGARPISLGGAYTALADDTSAIFTNPAGLGLQNRPSFTSMSTQVMGCVDYKLIGGVYPTIYGTLAIGCVNAVTPGGNRIYMEGATTVEAGAIYYSNSIITFSYGVNLGEIFGAENPYFEKISVGANLKMFYQGFSGDITGSPTARGTDIDLGLIYDISDVLSVGTVLQNFSKSSDGEMSWSTGEKEEIAGTTTTGIAYQPYHNIKTVFDIDLLEGEAPLALHGGIEWYAADYMTIRAGVDQNFESIGSNNMGINTDLSFGVGISFDGIKFDYAYHSNHAIPENSTHYFSVSYVGAPIEKPEPPKDEWDILGDLFEEAETEVASN